MFYQNKVELNSLKCLINIIQRVVKSVISIVQFQTFWIIQFCSFIFGGRTYSYFWPLQNVHNYLKSGQVKNTSLLRIFSCNNIIRYRQKSADWNTSLQQNVLINYQETSSKTWTEDVAHKKYHFESLKYETTQFRHNFHRRNSKTDYQTHSQTENKT